MAKKPVSSSKASLLGAAKLESSGLDPSQAKKLGLSFLSGEQTFKQHKSFKPLCSLKISYHDPHGKPIGDFPQAKPFYRLRYLELPKDFQSLTEKKPTRYVQEPNTAPVAYYPLNQDWSEILEDPSRPLVITEGEFKAIKGCEAGFPTVGLGGVYNWRSHKLGIEWLPSLEPINWQRRNVYICFDSDYKTNVMVCTALREFADALYERGAFVHVVTLPTVQGVDKVGLDDFLLREPPEQFTKLLHEAEPLGLTKILFELNESWVYVQDPGLMVNQLTLSKTTPAAFRDHVMSTKSYQEAEILKNGTITRNAVSAAGAWLKWPLRCEVHKLTYKPGAPKFVEATPPLYNSWLGWGVKPAKGDATPFLKLLEHLFTHAEPEAMDWFLKWCAFPLQYPGTKMFSCVVMHGTRHGTGKSFVGYTLGRIYGENFTEISQANLHGGFNEWAESRQFVMGDDISGSTKRQDADLLKKLITQQKMRINTKYIPSYVVPDCINYFFTANHPDSFFLEDDDRRNFIHEVQVGPLEEDFYKEYELWLDTGGAAAVFDYLLKLPLGGFNPAAPAMKTSAKERMIAIVQSDVATWVRSLIANPDYILRLGDIKLTKDLYTSKELLDLYDPTSTGQVKPNGMAIALKKAGVHQVTNGRPVKLKDGSQARYFAIRNTELWLFKTPKECALHIDDWATKQSTTPTKKY